MKEIFKEIILEFHGTRLPELVKRDVELHVWPKGVRKASVFVGMRRSGKTWAMYQIMRDLLEKGLDFRKILYINFEDERLIRLQTEHLQDILKAYFEIYPEYLGRSDLYFFFDEIHVVEFWDKFIRRLLDQEQMEITLTGSSAKMLSKEISTNLRGRTITQEIFPFNFKETLQKMHVVLPDRIGGKSKIQLMSYLENFLTWGGFPEAIGATPEKHRMLLQEYIATVLYRDVIDRYGVRNIHALKYVMNHCLRNSATIFSVNKIYNSLKSMGTEISKDSLYEYMGYFEEAYSLFFLQKFDFSHRIASTGMKKVFAVDQGLITAVTMSSDFDLGSQLETAVFSFIRRQTPEVFYYRTSDDREVDFAFLLRDQTLRLYQVCLTMKDPETRKREVTSLTKAMEECSLEVGTIITIDEEEEIVIQQGRIDVVPVWKLFLEGPIGTESL